MGFASVDDALELRVREDAIRYDIGRQMRPIGWLWRRDRRHCSRLHEPCGMGLRAGNADRLQCVRFVERVGDLAGIGGRPVDGLVGDFRRHELRCWRRGHRLALGNVGAEGSGR